MLAEGLATNYEMKLSENNVVAETRGIDYLVNAYKDHDYILDVKTLSWGSIYYRSSWSRYKVWYNTHARLIDRKSKRVVIEGSCSTGSPYEDPRLAPSYKQLEDGDRLKEELSGFVDVCIKYIRDTAKIKHEYPVDPPTSIISTANEESIKADPFSLEERLMASNWMLLRELALEYYAKEKVEQSELDLFAERIWVDRDSEDQYIVDVVAWYCKILEKNKNSRYSKLITFISEEARTKKLRKYAKRTLKSFPETSA